jgi:hypothetical protein
MRWTRERAGDREPNGAGIRLLFVIGAAALTFMITDPIRFGAALFRPAPSIALPEYANAVLPAYSPFTASFAASVLPWLCVGALLWLVAARLAARIRTWLSDSPRPDETLLEGEGGLLAVEYVLLLPTMMMLLLLILQTALMIHAKFVVNYAAFCAVRSAIVWIPAEKDSEGVNHIDNHDPSSSEKMKIIRRAAALAVTPISPRFTASLAESTGNQPGSDVDGDAEAAAERLQEFFPTDPSRPEVVTSFISRWAYAFDEENTTVEVLEHQDDGGNFGDHDPVTVRVNHRFYLWVPFASRVLGPLTGGQFSGGDGYYTSLSEQYTLFNEGEPLRYSIED